MQWYTSLACMKHGFWALVVPSVFDANSFAQRQAAAGDNHSWSGSTSPEVAGVRLATGSFSQKIKGAVTYNCIEFPFTFIYLVGKTGRYLSTQGYLPTQGYLQWYRVDFCISRFYRQISENHPTKRQAIGFLEKGSRNRRWVKKNSTHLIRSFPIHGDV